MVVGWSCTAAMEFFRDVEWPLSILLPFARARTPPATYLTNIVPMSPTRKTIVRNNLVDCVAQELCIVHVLADAWITSERTWKFNMDPLFGALIIFVFKVYLYNNGIYSSKWCPFEGCEMKTRGHMYVCTVLYSSVQFCTQVRSNWYYSSTVALRRLSTSWSGYLDGPKKKSCHEILLQSTRCIYVFGKKMFMLYVKIRGTCHFSLV